MVLGSSGYREMGKPPRIVPRMPVIPQDLHDFQQNENKEKRTTKRRFQKKIKVVDASMPDSEVSDIRMLKI